MTALPPGLLPEGLRDRLPGEAERQARAVRAMLDTIMSHGYDRVATPLAEFEEGLVGRLKSSRPQDLLRVVDPVSQRMLALRPDITPQIGRIAATRLAGAARPLRLAYSGPVIRLRASQLQPERETMQVGAELIGNDSVAAARETVSVAVEALTAAGARGLTVDLVMPDLVDVLAADAMRVDAERLPDLLALLDAKDAGGLTSNGFGDWLPLIEAAGPVDAAIARLRPLSPAIASRLSGIETIANSLDTRVTLDPTERHGFEYQSWFGFSVFAMGVTGEVGRGGSYTIAHLGHNEAATGFSLFPDALIDGDTSGSQVRTLFVPLGTDPSVTKAFRAQGYRTFAALDERCDARALGCTHHLANGEALKT